jgi:hypothetical protein
MEVSSRVIINFYEKRRKAETAKTPGTPRGTGK